MNPGGVVSLQPIFLLKSSTSEETSTLDLYSLHIYIIISLEFQVTASVQITCFSKEIFYF